MKAIFDMHPIPISNTWAQKLLWPKNFKHGKELEQTITNACLNLYPNIEHDNLNSSHEICKIKT
jgi:hypothetical protein